MPEILQVKTVHSGYPGAPGYTQMYFFGDPVNTAQVNSEMAAVHAFWTSIASQFPSIWSASIDPDCSVLDEVTGTLIRSMPGTPLSAISGGGTSQHAGGVGACVTWNTGAVHGRRRLRGRTFIVPLTVAAFQNDGSYTDSYRSGLQSAAATLAADAGFGVWGRPRKAVTVDGETFPALAGLWAGAESASVRDKVAILRSRRD